MGIDLKLKVKTVIPLIIIIINNKGKIIWTKGNPPTMYKITSNCSKGENMSMEEI